MEQPVLFDYLDYRAYLRDLFKYRKQKARYYSYRYFSAKAGFSSPNFLKLVSEGKRNLTNKSIPKVCKGFGFNKQEREFFENLVFMNQSKEHEEKNHYLKKMMSIRGYSETRKIEKKSYEYFSKWYNPAIREMAMLGDRKLTAEQIATLLNPKITPKEAEKALKLLQDLKLIKRDEQGRWEQSDPILSTGSEVKSLSVANFHREMLKIAAESIERHPSEKRDISALTLRINAKSMAEIKKKIEQFRKELLRLAFDDEDADQVVQINFQAFPLTGKE